MINRRTFLAASAATAGLGALGAGTARAATTLDFSSPWPDTNYHTRTARDFLAAVDTATNGEFTARMHSGGALGFKGPETLTALRDGLVPMAHLPTYSCLDAIPLFGLNTIPFMIKDLEELRVLQDIAAPIYEEQLAKNNVKILYYVPWGTQYLHLNTKISSLEDLRGLRVRTSEKAALDLVNAIGASGVIMPWGEIIPALASGRLDGVTTSSASAADGRFWEFMKVSYRTSHHHALEGVAMSMDAWNGLDAATQEALTSVAQEKEPEYWQVAKDDDAESVAKLREGGMEVTDVPAEMLAEMRERTAFLKDEFLEKVPEAAPILEAFNQKIGKA